MSLLLLFQGAAAGQTITVNQASETDTSQTVSVAPKRRLVGQAAETDTANAITAPHVVAVGRATETDTAQAIAGDTFPTILGVRHTHVTANATSTNALVPDGSNVNGYLVVAFASKDGVGTFTWPAGWTQIVAANDDGNVFVRGEWRYRIIDGTEGWDGTDDVIALTHASEETAVSVITYSVWHGTTPPEGASADHNGTPDANPNPPSLNPSGWGTEGTSWIAGLTGDGTQTVSGYPATYPDNHHGDNTGGIDGVIHAIATRQLSAASDDPGTFTLSTNNDWVAFTVAVRGVGTPAVDQASETDTAQAIAVAPKRRLVARASETDTAQAITPDLSNIITVGQALETDTARQISPPTPIIGQVFEYDRAKQIDVVGGFLPPAEFPVLIRAPLRAGRIFHEFWFQGDTYHPNIADFQAEESAPGGFGPATGRISDRIFRRHRDIMRADAKWVVWHEDGTCLHHGRLLEPDTSNGEVQLTDRGTASLADREVGPILYQAAIGEELGKFSATREDGKDVVIPMLGRQLAFLRCHVQGTKAELTVYTARGVRDPSLFNSAEIDTSDLYENFYMTFGPTGDYESAEIEVDLTAGSELLSFPNTTLLTNAGAEGTTGLGYVYPELIVFSVGDDTVLGSTASTEVLISNIEINGVAVGERQRFSAHDLVADISAILGVHVTTIEGGGFDILPYQLAAGTPAAEALDYASLVSGKMWRLLHNGQRAVLEFGVEKRWGLASPWSPFDAIPQERFDAVSVPFSYAGTTLEDQVIVRVENSPLAKRHVYWGLTLNDPGHNSDKARNLGARIAEELVRKRNAGSFAAAELLGQDGLKETAHHCFAGDVIYPLRPHERGRLRIARLTRFEDHIEGEFDGELHVLDRMLARREKRLPRLRYA